MVSHRNGHYPPRRFCPTWAARTWSAPRKGGSGRHVPRLAALRPTQDKPHGATAALAPVLDGSAPLMEPGGWLVRPFLLEAIAPDALGDPAAAERALQRLLDLAEPVGAILPFFLCPAPTLLEHHDRYGNAHAGLISEILDLLAEGSESQRRGNLRG